MIYQVGVFVACVQFSSFLLLCAVRVVPAERCEPTGRVRIILCTKPGRPEW